MKKVTRLVIFILVAGLIGLAAYFYFHPRKALQVIIPDLNTIKNIHVSLLQDTARIEVALEIQNKGLFKLNIDSLSYHVRLDTSTLLSERSFVGVELLRSQKDTLHLPIALPYKRLIKKIKSLQDQDSVDVFVDVRLVYSTVFGKAVLPYSKKLRIEVPTPPKFEVEKIEYLRREKKTGYFIIHVKMHNQGKIKLDVSDLHYHFVAKDLFDAEGSEKKEIYIEPRSNILVQLPVTVEFKSILKTIGRVITKNDMDYHLRITALIHNAKLGSQKTAIEVEKSGRMALRK